jgi:hypothetical protein
VHALPLRVHVPGSVLRSVLWCCRKTHSLGSVKQQGESEVRQVVDDTQHSINCRQPSAAPASMADGSEPFDEPPVDPQVDLGLTDGEDEEEVQGGDDLTDPLLATARFEDTLDAIENAVGGVEEDLAATARLEETAIDRNGAEVGGQEGGGQQQHPPPPPSSLPDFATARLEDTLQEEMHADGGGEAHHVDELQDDSDPDLDEHVEFEEEEDAAAAAAADQAAAAATEMSIPGGFTGATLRETQERLRRQAVRHHIEDSDTRVVELHRTVLGTEHQLQLAADRLVAKDQEVDEAVFAPALTVPAHQKASRAAEHARYVAKLESESARLTKTVAELRIRLEAESDELAQGKLSQARFIELGEELATADAKEERAFAIAGGTRAQAEYKLAQREVANARREIAERAAKEQASVVRKAQTKKAAVASLARAAPLMQASFAKASAVKQRQTDVADEEDRRKIKAVMSLKGNSDTAAEKDRRRAAARVKRDKKAQDLEKTEHAAILKEGGNPEAVFLSRKRNAETVAKREAVVEQARQNREAIVQTMLREETEYERRQEQSRKQPLAGTKKVPKKSKIRPKLASPEAATSSSAMALSRPQTTDAANQDEDTEAVNNMSSASLLKPKSAAAAKAAETEDEEEDDDDVYAQPEFAGLWSGQGGTTKVTSSSSKETEDVHRAESANNAWKKMGLTKLAANAFGTVSEVKANQIEPRVYTKLEAKILDDALVRQKAGIVKEQVVAGRTFSGTPFSAKPERVVFTDFEVGKTYRQKIVLTNISYSTNSFQLLPTPATFIDYEYKPSGGLSPGMTTEMTVVFTPRLNEDVDLAVALLAHTGPFSIPLVCTTKKCKVSCTPETINFGHLVIGETEIVTLRLKNEGALGTGWNLIHEVEEGGQHVSDTPPAVTILSHAGGGMAGPESAAGMLDPHSSTSVTLRFKPYELGPTQSVFKLVFSDPDTLNHDIVVSGQCDASPIYLVEPTIDFNVCRVNCAYASPVVVKNRHLKQGTNVSFDIPKAARKFVTMSAYRGAVPALSELRTEIFVNPTTDMLAACAAFLEPSTADVIKLPITIVVEDQVLPIVLDLIAQVTPYGVEISESSIDFGFVTVHESAVAKVTLKNTSCLPQRFGFVDVPSCLSVQPGDGFGELLPLESRVIDMIFSPQPLPDDDGDRKYNFSVVCQWNSDGGQRTISCRGVGVVPPVRLSTASVKFAAVAAGDESWSSVSITNTSDRARRFEFALPAECAVSVTPRSGLIEPNGVQMIHLKHSPTVPATVAAPPPLAPAEISNNATSGDEESAATNDKPTEQLVGRLDKLTVPCATQLAHGLHATEKLLSEFEPRDLVYLELQMPVVPAKLGFVDNKASVVYTDIAVGSTSIQHVTVENYTDEELPLHQSALAPGGPFRIVGAIRPIPPLGTRQVRVCFEPETAGDFFAELELTTDQARIRFRLAGMSVQPSLQVEVTTLDLGDLLPGQVATKKLKMVNVSPFPVTVVTRLQSEVSTRREFCPALHSDTENLPAFSMSPVPALACTPSECTIAPKGEAFVDVTFSPDRSSSKWIDYLYVKLTTEELEQKVALVARSWAYPVFVVGGELSAPPIEEDPLCAVVPAIEERENPMYVPTVVVAEPVKGAKVDKSKQEKAGYIEKRELQFQFSLSSGENSISQSITLSMLKAQVVDKGGAKGDFSFDVSGSSSMFVIENGKNSIDPGAPKQVEVKFKPPDLASVLSGLVYKGEASLTVKAAGAVQRYDFDLSCFVAD